MIEQFIQWLNTQFANEQRTYYLYNTGKKYYKIAMKLNTSISVYCFVEIKTGNIYFPNSWKTPSTVHIRGHISDPANCCHKYGIKYLK